MNRKGFAPILIVLIIVVIALAGVAFWYLGTHLAGGGGSDQIAPDSVQAGQPAVVTVVFDVTGAGGPINGRYTDIVFYYRVAGESAYKTLQPQAVALPDNYQKASSANLQFEAYNFTIPAYPTGTVGNIQYYYEMKLDGVQNHADGYKEIQITPANATNTTSSTPTLGSITQSTATVSFEIPFKGYQITLHAPDQVASKVSGDFCGGNQGAAMYDGTYQIIAKKGSTTISAVPIGQMEFIAGTPHDGLNTVTYQPTGDQFIVVNEYGSCAGDYSSFYAINSTGQLISIPFIGNGTSTIWVPEGFSGANASTNNTFCSYDNAVVAYFCDAYQYQNYSFTQTDSWVVNDPDTGTLQKSTAIGEAERYLFSFGDSNAIKPYVPSDAEYIDEIDEIETSTLPYEFQVDFANSGLNDYQYFFKVNKTQNGFEAVLPPQQISK